MSESEDAAVGSQEDVLDRIERMRRETDGVAQEDAVMTVTTAREELDEVDPFAEPANDTPVMATSTSAVTAVLPTEADLDALLLDKAGEEPANPDVNPFAGSDDSDDDDDTTNQSNKASTTTYFGQQVSDAPLSMLSTTTNEDEDNDEPVSDTPAPLPFDENADSDGKDSDLDSTDDEAEAKRVANIEEDEEMALALKMRRRAAGEESSSDEEPAPAIALAEAENESNEDTEGEQEEEEEKKEKPKKVKESVTAKTPYVLNLYGKIANRFAHMKPQAAAPSYAEREQKQLEERAKRREERERAKKRRRKQQRKQELAKTKSEHIGFTSWDGDMDLDELELEDSIDTSDMPSSDSSSDEGHIDPEKHPELLALGDAGASLQPAYDPENPNPVSSEDEDATSEEETQIAVEQDDTKEQRTGDDDDDVVVETQIPTELQEQLDAKAEAEAEAAALAAEAEIEFEEEDIQVAYNPITAPPTSTSAAGNDDMTVMGVETQNFEDLIAQEFAALQAGTDGVLPEFSMAPMTESQEEDEEAEEKDLNVEQKKDEQAVVEKPVAVAGDHEIVTEPSVVAAAALDTVTSTTVLEAVSSDAPDVKEENVEVTVVDELAETQPLQQNTQTTAETQPLTETQMLSQDSLEAEVQVDVDPTTGPETLAETQLLETETQLLDEETQVPAALPARDDIAGADASNSVDDAASKTEAIVEPAVHPANDDSFSALDTTLSPIPVRKQGTKRKLEETTDEGTALDTSFDETTDTSSGATPSPAQRKRPEMTASAKKRVSAFLDVEAEMSGDGHDGRDTAADEAALLNSSFVDNDSSQVLNDSGLTAPRNVFAADMDADDEELEMFKAKFLPAKAVAAMNRVMKPETKAVKTAATKSAIVESYSSKSRHALPKILLDRQKPGKKGKPVTRKDLKIAAKLWNREHAEFTSNVDDREDSEPEDSVLMLKRQDSIRQKISERQTLRRTNSMSTLRRSNSLQMGNSLLSMPSLGGHSRLDMDESSRSTFHRIRQRNALPPSTSTSPSLPQASPTGETGPTDFAHIRADGNVNDDDATAAGGGAGSSGVGTSGHSTLNKFFTISNDKKNIPNKRHKPNGIGSHLKRAVTLQQQASLGSARPILSMGTVDQSGEDVKNQTQTAQSSNPGDVDFSSFNARIPSGGIALKRQNSFLNGSKAIQSDMKRVKSAITRMPSTAHKKKFVFQGIGASTDKTSPDTATSPVNTGTKASQRRHDKPSKGRVAKKKKNNHGNSMPTRILHPETRKSPRKRAKVSQGLATNRFRKRPGAKAK